MHPLYSHADQLSGSIIAAAIEVHRTLGPSLLERIYERCMIRELELRGIRVSSQQSVQIRYKDVTFEETLKFDLLIEGSVLVEIKAIQGILPIHKAQIMSYMKLMDVPLGLLFNFHEMILMDGFAPLLLPGANRN